MAHTKPSGIDRVERAYARHFLERPDRDARFVARASALGARSLDGARLSEFLDCLDRGWLESGKREGFTSLSKLVTRSRAAGDPDDAITIIPSHQNWHRREWLRKRKGRKGKLVLFLHDIIPIDFPEYAREGGARRHRQRLSNALQLADAFLVNSAATGQALERIALEEGREVDVTIAPLGVEQLAPSPDPKRPAHPYFVCVGTIEPRKNHMLLLHIWRSLGERLGKDAPQLHIVGRRGWENENILDLLDRSTPLQDLVVEHGELGDRDLASLLGGARALLMPSFVEGFGMPVNEALAIGIPVIASNLPVYRETAGDVPDYLDPLDGPGWTDRILDYAKKETKSRQDQLERIESWQPPCWDHHFDQLHELLDRLD